MTCEDFLLNARSKSDFGVLSNILDKFDDLYNDFGKFLVDNGFYVRSAEPLIESLDDVGYFEDGYCFEIVRRTSSNQKAMFETVKDILIKAFYDSIIADAKEDFFAAMLQRQHIKVKSDPIKETFDNAVAGFVRCGYKIFEREDYYVLKLCYSIVVPKNKNAWVPSESPFNNVNMQELLDKLKEELAQDEITITSEEMLAAKHQYIQDLLLG